MANAPQTAASKHESSKAGSNLFASLSIVICFIIGAVVWKFIMGDPANFIDNNPENQPKEGNYFGMVYHAGYVVPVLLGLFLMVFLKIFMVGCVLAVPVAYLMADKWLAGFAYRSPISFAIFGASLLGLLLITLVTVSYETWKAAKTNPVNSLRSE